MCPLIPIRKPLLCYVTDGQAGLHPSRASIERLLEKITHAANAGVEWIQIREKDLLARQLAEIFQEARRVPKECRMLINDRLDVAIAVGAGGVHLGEKSVSVADAKRMVFRQRNLDNFVVGASVHSLEAALKSEQEGADYLIFGPIFATPSKVSYGPAQGLPQLEKVSRSVSIPVLAIGGITQQSAQECLDHGAAGIAAVRLFQESKNLEAWIQSLRR